MADIVNFGTIQTELKEAEFLEVMQVLHRDSKWNARNQLPMVLLLTDKSIYHGGTEAYDKNFFRIPLKSVTSAKITGKSFWKCLEIVYRHKDKEIRAYLCPFKGEASRPEIDVGALTKLKGWIKQLKNENP